MPKNIEQQLSNYDEKVANTQEIFKTAKLKTIIPESPEQEEKVEKIKEQIIDIEKYKGLIQHTQLANIEGIIIDGIRRGKDTREKRRWGYAGRLGGLGSHSGWATLVGKNSSFREWENIPWSDAGPLALLFDLKKIETIHFIDHYDRKQRRYRPITLADFVSSRLDTDIEEIDLGDTVIPGTAIMGIVVSPKESKVEITKKKDYDPYYTEGKAKFKIITPKQAAEIASNRLTRLFNNHPEAHLVPLYDNKGNVLWPEKIPSEKIT